MFQLMIKRLFHLVLKFKFHNMIDIWRHLLIAFDDLVVVHLFFQNLKALETYGFSATGIIIETMPIDIINILHFCFFYLYFVFVLWFNLILKCFYISNCGVIFVILV